MLFILITTEALSGGNHAYVTPIYMVDNGKVSLSANAGDTAAPANADVTMHANQDSEIHAPQAHVAPHMHAASAADDALAVKNSRGRGRGSGRGRSSGRGRGRGEYVTSVEDAAKEASRRESTGDPQTENAHANENQVAERAPTQANRGASQAPPQARKKRGRPHLLRSRT